MERSQERSPSFTSVTMKEAANSTREKWLASLKEGLARKDSRRREMHKVPELFLANERFNGAYKPKVVSLGPYHWGNEELMPYQERKHSMADRLKLNIKNIDKLMAYPQESEKFDSISKWEEMLFLDGCFILYFIFCVMYNRVEDLKMNKYEIDSVHNDLFLLENQLPFGLLKILSGNDSELLDLVDEYICTHKIGTGIDSDCMKEEPAHLLDRLRTIIIGGEPQKWKHPIWKPHRSQEAPQLKTSLGTKSTVLRPAKELAARGIHFKLNRTGLLKDIFFKSHFIYGTLRLPRIIVDDSTSLLFLNLAAYEMCANIDSTITSYICFLDSLVNHADDIRELQSAGILVNHLATDELAANLFNNMSQGLHPDIDAYMDVKKKIQRFFGHKTNSCVLF